MLSIIGLCCRCTDHVHGLEIQYQGAVLSQWPTRERPFGDALSMTIAFGVIVVRGHIEFNNLGIIFDGTT